MRRSLTLAVLFTAFSAFAQEGGRTDGAEGSEQGKGGYEKVSGSSRFSLRVDWGAAIPIGTAPPLSGSSVNGAPLYLGGTATLWLFDWFLLDAQGSHSFDRGRTNIFIGPRFRTTTWPVAASVGLRAGAIIDPSFGLRFGLSPVVGVEMIFLKHLLLGLEGSVDIPIGSSSSSLRIGLNIGWRF